MKQAVVELKGEACNAFGMSEIGIKSIRPELHAPRGKELDLLALRQPSTPDRPQRIGPDHFGAVVVDALGARGQNSLPPLSARMWIGKNMTRDGGGPEHVEIVNFTEQVLDLFEVIAPSLVLNREKVFYDVTEALDADSQTVESQLRSVVQRLAMKFASGGPALQGEMLEKRVAQADARGPGRERLAPLAPLFAIELFESGLRFMLLLLFSMAENSEKSVRGGIGAGIGSGLRSDLRCC